jgi:hypothetical protein
MIYTASITTPANTQPASALWSKLLVVAGVVYKIEIDFPPGPCGLLYCQIYHNSVITWPSTPDEYFNTDGYTISFDDTYQLKDEPLFFMIKTWNIDDTNAHTLQIRIGVVSEDIYIGRYLPMVAYKQAVDILANLYQQQQLQNQALLANPFTFTAE